MELRNLGRSGLRISSIGLGCNNFGWRTDLEASRAVVHKALDCGINFFDTADTYGGFGGSEKILGEILGDRRKDVIVATKFGMPMDREGVKRGASRRYIMAEVEDSLKRLNTDYIDLYQLHEADPLTPIDETLRALDDLVRAGKVRYIGTSNMKAWEVARATHVARELNMQGFISVQDELNLISRENEKELIPAAQAYGMGFLPYFPLASGLLTGKYKRDQALPSDSRLGAVQRMADRHLNEANWDKTEKLAAFCAARGKTLVELAFSWLNAQPAVTCIMAGATRPEQVEANVKAAQWALSAQDLKEIDALTL